MNLKIVSLLGLGIIILGAYYLYFNHYLFAKNPVAIIIQLCSVGLMIWARLTFGKRSFHGAANTTEGGLVTTGPYRWLRHPIYAAIIYFFLGCIIAYPFLETIGAVLLIIGGLSVRMFCEESFLLVTYTEYAAYCKTAKRIIPFVY